MSATMPIAPGTILGHVDAIRASHRRLTGLELSWPEAIRRLDAFNAMHDDPTMPPKLWEVQVGCFLVAESYSSEAILRAIRHCATYGTAAHSEDLDTDDVEAVDLLLPIR
jgi:hypothetical protein